MNIMYLIVHANTEEDIHKRYRKIWFSFLLKKIDEPAEFPSRGDRCREGCGLKALWSHDEHFP